MLDFPLSITLNELVNHFERVYIDGNILSGHKPNRMPWGSVCDFSKHLGQAQRFHDVNIRILRQQEQYSRRLSEILQEICLYSTEEILAEYNCLINHIANQLKWLRDNSSRRRGEKQESLEHILEYQRVIRNRLKIEQGCDGYASMLKTKRLHLPRVSELTKRTMHVEEECSDADASLVSAAIAFGRRVAILSQDLDVSNLVFNFGQDLRRTGNSHQIVGYYSRQNQPNSFQYDFSVNDQFTYMTMLRITSSPVPRVV